MRKHGETVTDPNELQNDDRRRFPRFRVEQDTLLYNQDSFAEILDISSGGFACRGHVDQVNGSEIVTELDLLNCDQGLTVKGLCCRKVRKQPQETGRRPEVTETAIRFYEFIDLSPKQRLELTRFVKSCASGQRSEVVFS